MIETPRSIARDGGWRVWSPTTGQMLIPPWRHHRVAGRSGTPDVYILPICDVLSPTLGINPPIGTVVWVHNRGGAGTHVVVQTDDASFTHNCLQNCSTAYMLVAATAEDGVGQWIVLRSNYTSEVGPAVPTGFRLDLEYRRSQNNVNLLADAVAAGYDGTEPALIIAKVFPGVVIGSDNTLTKAFDVGGDAPVAGVNWDTGTFIFIDLTDAVISGAPGAGGGGGVGQTVGTATDGEDGGGGLRAPVDCTIASTGRIQGGGGGGGGGAGHSSTAGLHGGAGAGGAGANVGPGGYVHGGEPGFGATGTQQATEGTLFLPGVFGRGTTVGGNVGGRGGFGGLPGAAGENGWNLNNVAATATLGGAAGPAISKAPGVTVTFLPGAGGIVEGSTIVE